MDGSGYYEAGARKCSVCQEMKTKKDFNAEEAAKPASKRCCNECGAGLPKDLSKTTVVQLKAELTKRGLPVTGLKVSFAASSIVSLMICVRGFQHDCLCEQALKTPFGSFSLLSQRLRSSSASRQPWRWNLLSLQTQSQRPRGPSRSPRTNTSSQCQSLTIHHRYRCLLLVASSLSMTLNTIECPTQHTLPGKARTHQNSFTALLTRDPAGAVVPAASPPGSPAEAQPRKHRLDSTACPQ